MSSAASSIGRVLPHPVGTELRMWSLSCDSAAAVTSACDGYNWMPVSRFPAVPGNHEFLWAMQDARSEAEHRHPWSQLSFAVQGDQLHHPHHRPSSQSANSPLSFQYRWYSETTEVMFLKNLDDQSAVVYNMPVGHSCKIGNMRPPGTLENQNPQFEKIFKFGLLFMWSYHIQWGKNAGPPCLTQ